MTERVRETAGWPRRIDRRWRGAAVAGLVAVTGALAVVALHQPASLESRFAVVEPAAVLTATRSDPLMAELIRCRALPPQADDPGCRAAWDENRRRFFGETRAARVPADPMPRSAPSPSSGTAAPTQEH